MKSGIRMFSVAVFALFWAQLHGQSFLDTGFNGVKNDNLKENKALCSAQGITTDTVVANFTASDTIVTVWKAVHFTNLSTGNPTFQKWFFPGASPSLSYAANPVVIYHTPGIYDVKLVVSGLNGSDTLVKKDYIEAMPEQSSLPPGWEFEESATKHPVFLPMDSNPRIFEEALNPGDYVGVFYMDDEDSLKCGGAIVWNDTAAVAVVANGDNPYTGSKDGFEYGEPFTFKLYSMLRQEEFIATPVFDPLLPFTFFVPGGISGLLDLSAGKSVEIVFPEGWSGISSHVLPWENLMGEVFNSNQGELIIITDGANFFKPDFSVNTLEVWENKAYFVKMNSETSIQFDGYPQTLNFNLQEGWNFLPVPIGCDIDIQVLFQENISKIKIIKEIAGLNIYWPEQAVYSLEKLMHGKAYTIFATAGFSIEFVPCN